MRTPGLVSFILGHTSQDSVLRFQVFDVRSQVPSLRCQVTDYSPNFPVSRLMSQVPQVMSQVSGLVSHV